MSNLIHPGEQYMWLFLTLRIILLLLILRMFLALGRRLFKYGKSKDKNTALDKRLVVEACTVAAAFYVQSIVLTKFSVDTGALKSSAVFARDIFSRAYFWVNVVSGLYFLVLLAFVFLLLRPDRNIKTRMMNVKSVDQAYKELENSWLELVKPTKVINSNFLISHRKDLRTAAQRIEHSIEVKNSFLFRIKCFNKSFAIDQFQHVRSLENLIHDLNPSLDKDEEVENKINGVNIKALRNLYSRAIHPNTPVAEASTAVGKIRKDLGRLEVPEATLKEFQHQVSTLLIKENHEE